ncbi:hypothetical protein EON67_03950, partial [archaeon]
MYACAEATSNSVITKHVPLAQVYKGGIVSVAVTRQSACPACHGAVKYANHQVQQPIASQVLTLCDACNGTGIVHAMQSSTVRGPCGSRASSAARAACRAHAGEQGACPHSHTAALLSHAKQCTRCNGFGYELIGHCTRCKDHGFVQVEDTVQVAFPAGVGASWVRLLAVGGLHTPFSLPGNISVQLHAAAISERIDDVVARAPMHWSMDDSAPAQGWRWWMPPPPRRPAAPPQRQPAATPPPAVEIDVGRALRERTRGDTHQPQPESFSATRGARQAVAAMLNRFSVPMLEGGGGVQDLSPTGSGAHLFMRLPISTEEAVEGFERNLIVPWGGILPLKVEGALCVPGHVFI